MNLFDFENILQKPESNILDYKLKYDFSGSKNAKRNKQKKFVIDVASFSNTIRYEPSYIIIGIKDDKELVGIDIKSNYRDDAKFQQIVNNFNINPFPNFFYDEIEFKNKIFGIIEFPLPSNSEAVSIDGAVYGRHGSSNALLNTYEIKNVNIWLEKIASINYKKFASIVESQKVNKYINEKNLEKAKEELNKQIIELDKKKAENEYMQALLYEIEGKNEEAKKAYLKALNYDNDNPIYLKELAMIYYEMDDYRNAINTSNKLLKMFNYDTSKIDNFLQKEAVLTASKIKKAKIYADIGALMFFQGRKEESKAKLLKAYEIFKLEYSETHEKTQNVLSVLKMIDKTPVSKFQGIDIEKAIDLLNG